MTSSFSIVDIGELSTSQVLEVINTAFGRSESEDWYRWKHRDGPWGPSIGVAAIDGNGPIGVRLLLPWRLRLGESTFDCHRATEAATVPRAQGRGVFTALNRWMMEQVKSDLIFSTPNVNSREGYLKLGWREIATVPHRWELATRPRRAAGTTPSTVPDGLRTDWDLPALQWRSDPRCGNIYGSISTNDAVLYYRTLRRRGLPIVVPMAFCGNHAQRTLLWRDMLKRTRAALVLRPATQDAPGPQTRLAVQRGASLILGWTSGTGAISFDDPRVTRFAQWSSADIEGVI